MQIAKLLKYQLQQLKKNNYPTYSITKKICFDIIIEIQKNNQNTNKINKSINQYLQLFHNVNKKSVFQLLTLLLFNISSLNQQYFKQLQNYILQSTSIENHQEQVDQNLIKNIKQNFRIWIYNFLNINYLKKIIISKQQNQQYHILIETIDYLSLKYQLELDYQKSIIQYLENIIHRKQISVDIINNINKFIFGNGYCLVQFLNNHCNVNQNYIIQLIHANYSNLVYSRPIFKSCEITGKKVIQDIFEWLLKQKREAKDLFTHEYAKNHHIFKFFMKFIKDRFSSIALNFSTKFIENQQSPKSQTTQTNICMYFLQLPFQQIQFHTLINYMYQSLLHRYGKSVSIDLLKKLILNRFFLDPSLHHTYWDQINQLKLTKFTQKANNLRVLFYDQKSKQKKYNNSKVKQSIQKFLSSKPQKSRNFANKVYSLYIPDKVLHLCYNRLSSQINLDNSYSVSFSLLKNQSLIKNSQHPQYINPQNSFNKKQPKIPQNNQHQSSRDNHSLRMLLQDMKSQKSYINQVQQKPKIIQKNNNQQKKYNQIDDDNKLIQLIALRRMYGQKKRQINHKYNDKAQKWKVKSQWLKSISRQFKQWRKQLDKSASYVKTTIDII